MTTDPHKTRQEVEELIGAKLAGASFGAPAHEARSWHGDWPCDHVRFTTPDEETIPALFLHPEAPDTPVPAVLYCHAHGNRYEVGMRELMDGRPTLQGSFGPALQALGIASLCLEMPAFGARQEQGESARAKHHLWHGSTLFGQMLTELAAALHFLADHPHIDENRLGVLGFSMGSTHAFWLAALNERVRAAVALCSFADLACLAETPAHDGPGFYMTVPGLLNRYRTGEIAGLAAPRALFIGVGLEDWSTPELCFAKGRADLEAAYADTPDQLAFHVEPHAGHEETPAMRAAVLGFLERKLCH